MALKSIIRLGQRGAGAVAAACGNRFSRRASAGLLLVVLAACGFEMRGTSPMPFETLYITIPENSRFGAEVRRALHAASPDTRFVATAKEAQAQLQQLENSRSMREVSLNAAGRVEEFELGVRIVFRVIDAKGRVLLPDTTLQTYRGMPYDDSLVQAKEGQAEVLYRSMQSSLVSQLVRRMTSPDLHAAFVKANDAKPGDDDLPITTTQPPPVQQPEPWNTPSIINGPTLNGGFP